MYSGPQRKNLRLKSFDYNQAGYYFVTICCKNREHFFGEIREGNMQYSQMGELVRQEIESNIRENMMIDTYVIMPNHTQAIIVIQETDVQKNHVGGDGIVPGTDNSSGINITPTMYIAPGINIETTHTNTGTMQSFPTLSRMIRGFKGRVTSQIL